MEVPETSGKSTELEMTDNYTRAARHRALFSPVRFADYSGGKDKTFGVISHQTNESVSWRKPLNPVPQMTHGPACRWFFADLG